MVTFLNVVFSRPSASELLKNPFFKKAKVGKGNETRIAFITFLKQGKDFIKEVVIGNGPSLAARAAKVL